MNKRISVIGSACAAIALAIASSAAGAQDLGKLGGMIPGGGSMTSGSMGNVAGLLEYCVKNNYLGGNSGASGVQSQLMGKLGGGGSNSSSNSTGSNTSDMLGQLTGSKNKSADSSTTAATGSATNDPAYLSGAKGILQGSNGQSVDLNSVGGGSSDIKSQMTTKVCDTVLKQGKSFLK